MRTIESIAYKFNELPEEAKEKAIDKNRNVDYNWSEYSIDYFKEVGESIGIQIDSVYWRGFWSQGSGACFVGSYEYKAGWKRKLKKEVKNEEIIRIGKELQEASKKSFYTIQANIYHSGTHYHERSVTIDVSDENTRSWYSNEPDHFEDVREALMDFMVWIYRKLEEEYEYFTSDEQVSESLISNEYEFDEEGNIV